MRVWKKELTPDGIRFYEKIHSGWRKQAVVIKKVVKSKVLTKEEAQMIVDIYSGNLCQYYGGDLGVGYKMTKRLEKLIGMVYR